MGPIISAGVSGVKRMGNDVVSAVVQPLGPFTAVDRFVSDGRRTIRGVANATASKIGVGKSRGARQFASGRYAYRRR